MKYVVSYECRNEAGKFTSEFEIESEQPPSLTDNSVIESALRDSVKLHQSGFGTITINAIKPATKSNQSL